MPYLDLQSDADRRLAHGIRFYGKSGFVTKLTPQSIERLVDVFVGAPPGSFSIVLQQSGGAIGRRPVSATAFPNRRANYWREARDSFRIGVDSLRKVTSAVAIEPIDQRAVRDGVAGLARAEAVLAMN